MKSLLDKLHAVTFVINKEIYEVGKTVFNRHGQTIEFIDYNKETDYIAFRYDGRLRTATTATPWTTLYRTNPVK